MKLLIHWLGEGSAADDEPAAEKFKSQEASAKQLNFLFI
jgi:hypothetical protein